MAPLQAWSCDTCGEAVTDPSRGLVVWRETPGYGYFDFKIVHKTFAEEPHPAHCDPGSAAGYMANLDLGVLLGADGLTQMLSWLSVGPLRFHAEPGASSIGDLDAYVDLVRRVQIPWYEEARGRFKEPETRDDFADANEYYPYVPEVLERLAPRPPGE